MTICKMDFNRWGCPCCGSRRAYERASVPGGVLLRCAGVGCTEGFVVVDDGEVWSPFQFKIDGRWVRPMVEPHPLQPHAGAGAPGGAADTAGKVQLVTVGMQGPKTSA